ncbi:MAG: hypothetical protein H7232_04895 [Aeromicrobium sp.]|nr:hypothetical protein [Burkholderiales bacterium]
MKLNLSPRAKFVLMFVLFSLPITASYLMFFFWKPKTTNNFGDLVVPVVQLPEVKFDALDAKDAPAFAASKGFRGKWLILMRDSGACEAACAAKLHTMRQARLVVGKELDRVVRVMLIDDGLAVPTKLTEDNTGTAFVSAKDSIWLDKLPRVAGDTSDGRGYIYAVDPMGNLFMRYRADQDIKQLAADLRRVLKASQLGKDFESAGLK